MPFVKYFSAPNRRLKPATSSVIPKRTPMTSTGMNSITGAHAVLLRHLLKAVDRAFYDKFFRL